MTDTNTANTHRVLDGIRVLDLGGIGPGPYAAMLLADQGAHVMRINRPVETAAAGLVPEINPVLDRGKHSVTIDIKNPDGVAAVHAIAKTVDVVIEGFRPGVAERLGLGPAQLFELNPALVYGRITGWGQSGPFAQAAGHDVNYIAHAGVLSRLARNGQAPQFPVNLLGDFGGGGMQLAFGVTAALTRAARTGQGCVVNAAMLDGASHLWSMMYGFEATGHWHCEPGTNPLDGGSPLYNIYETADHRHVAVACLEKQFFDEFVTTLGVTDQLPEPLASFKHQHPKHQALLRSLFTRALAQHSAAEISNLFDGTNACVSVILTTAEARAHPHNTARDAFYRDAAGTLQPAPVPRFQLAEQVPSPSPAEPPLTAASKTSAPSTMQVLGGHEPYVVPQQAPVHGAATEETLLAAGLTPARISQLRAQGVIGRG